MKTKNDAYLRAAMDIHSEMEFYSCVSIELNGGNSSLYRDIFSPEKSKSDSWLHDACRRGLIRESEMKEWRVIALLFMHWMSQ
jgi:hypothetical protein